MYTEAQVQKFESEAKAEIAELQQKVAELETVRIFLTKEVEGLRHELAGWKISHNYEGAKPACKTISSATFYTDKRAKIIEILRQGPVNGDGYHCVHLYDSSCPDISCPECIADRILEVKEGTVKENLTVEPYYHESNGTVDMYTPTIPNWKILYDSRVL